MRNFLYSLLDWIYKKKCYFCGSSKESTKMCFECYSELEHLPIEVNRQIGEVKVFCSGAYENYLQKMIRGLKYHKQRDLAHYQAKFMYEYWHKIDSLKKYQVVPVPIYHEREKIRKYNHMNLVAEEFCKLSGYELNLGLIKRVKDTKPQYKLTKNQRMQNLDSAFVVDKKNLLEYDILIIDDICTTGSTFESMIGEFNKQGIKNIVCFATTTPF